jgi:hypothetical protein
MTRELLFLMTAEQALAFARQVEAAERGDGAAACELGDRYRVGAGGLRYSPQQTFHWYSRSALAGDANGQCNLGACYEHGLGCTQSYVEAVKWYRLSAALRLFRLAVEQGEEKARPEIERLEGTVASPKVRIVYVTEPGKHFGLVVCCRRLTPPRS